MNATGRRRKEANKRHLWLCRRFLSPSTLHRWTKDSISPRPESNKEPGTGQFNPSSPRASPMVKKHYADSAEGCLVNVIQVRSPVPHKSLAAAHNFTRLKLALQSMPGQHGRSLRLRVVTSWQSDLPVAGAHTWANTIFSVLRPNHDALVNLSTFRPDFCHGSRPRLTHRVDNQSPSNRVQKGEKEQFKTKLRRKAGARSERACPADMYSLKHFCRNMFNIREYDPRSAPRFLTCKSCNHGGGRIERTFKTVNGDPQQLPTLLESERGGRKRNCAVTLITFVESKKSDKRLWRKIKFKFGGVLMECPEKEIDEAVRSFFMPDLSKSGIRLGLESEGFWLSLGNLRLKICFNWRLIYQHLVEPSQSRNEFLQLPDTLPMIWVLDQGNRTRMVSRRTPEWRSVEGEDNTRTECCTQCQGIE
ncbi:hypothetical protein DFH06DRAFT_1372922 [Mycena polygramma]|nr:hypothetical protein DFH06DRAFT_1372922 [Mycena polygramma]